MTVLENRIQKKFGTAIILAGGKSSRMGFDKQFLQIDNRRIMDDLIHNLEQEFDEIIIVTNKPKEYSNYKHKIVKDIIVGKGPLSGIHVGLKGSSSDYAFVVACDMPNINLDYIEHMKQSMEDKKIDGCVTYLGNLIEPFHGFYSKEIIGGIENHLENNMRSVTKLISNLNFLKMKEEEARKYSPNWDMFLNLNNQQDIDKYIINLQLGID